MSRKKKMIISLISLVLIISAGCSKNSVYFGNPEGTFTSENGTFEKVVFSEDNRVKLFYSEDTIISTVYTLDKSRLIVKSDTDISFRLFSDKILVGENDDRGNLYIINRMVVE